ncbi:armadillo repeat-containing protein 10-like [Callorhinchus milii]|uniref:armadillo repeat-containing protein 10-like n=1 Tax=Callorhinchus milii TaxID=7868 RepID=UPI001C3F653F|nr:armadillo repeat-containing protein 10-like [Callorhinchus milii]
METDSAQRCRGDVVALLSGTGTAYLVYKAVGLRSGAEGQESASGRGGGGGDGGDGGDDDDDGTLLSVLKQNPDPTVTALVRTGVCRLASLTADRDLLRLRGGIGVIAESLHDPLTEIRVDALNALRVLFEHPDNREAVRGCTRRVCELLRGPPGPHPHPHHPPDSRLRSAALRLLGSLSQCRQDQLSLRRSIPELLALLHGGSAQTQTQALRVCLNLSTNPELAFDILNTRLPPAFLSALSVCSRPDLLKGRLTFLSNVNEIRRSAHYAAAAAHREYNEESLCALLFTGSHFSNRLFPLMTHPDSGVYLLTAKILTKLRS